MSIMQFGAIYLAAVAGASASIGEVRKAAPCGAWALLCLAWACWCSEARVSKPRLDGGEVF